MNGRLMSLVAVLVAVSVNAQAQAILPPGTPTNLTVDPGGSSADFEWTAPAGGGVDGYRLTITPVPDTDPSSAVVVETGPETFKEVQLPDGTYTAVVQAFNAAGASPPSARSAEFTIAPLGPPENFTASVAGNFVTFGWIASFTGAPPDTYHIEIGIPGEETTQTRVVTVPAGARGPFSVSVPLGNGVYVARAKGVEEDRAGTPTPDLTFIVGPPPTGAVPFPPSGLVADILGTTVTLRWNMRADSPPVSSFLLHVSTAAGTPVGTIDTRSTARSVTFTNVPNGSYAVRVSAQNAHGPSQRSSLSIFVAVNAGGATCGALLDPPTGLSYSKSGNFVALAWARPATGSSVTGYLIDISGTINTTIATGNQSTVIAGFVSNGTYTVQVRAHDACSSSAPSNQVVITVP